MAVMGRRLSAFLGMFTGSLLVFFLLYAMNEFTDKPEKEKPKEAAAFVVDKAKKKPPKRQKPKPRKTRKTKSTARRAPAPNIGTSLSGLSFDLPQFENADLTAGSDRLLGGAGDDKSLVMTEDSVDSLPTPRSRTAPAYPDKARSRGITGYVTLKLKVTEDGRVERVKVVDSNPVGVFEDSAIAAVQNWSFDPATYKGEPVAIEVTQKIPFRLN